MSDSTESSTLSTVFDIFASNAYRLGHCSVVPYNRHDSLTFSDDFLLKLYRQSKPTLASTFCGMTDLSASSICAYLSTRSPLLLMCVDDDTDAGFTVIGYSFPTIIAGPRQGSVSPDPGRSMMLGYTFFREYYRTPEIVVGMMLAGIYFFNEFNLLTLQGQSIPGNHLTRKFLAQFGTRDVGVLPKFLFNGREMLDSYQSCLDRDVFAEYCRQVLLDCSQI